MKNATAICSIVRQIGKSCDQVESLTTAIGSARYGSEPLGAIYENMILDAVEHIQILTLELTRQFTDEELDGETAFGPGELQSRQGARRDPAKKT